MKQKLISLITSRTFKNSSWNAVEVLALPILMIFFTPLFLRKLGESTYGQWVLINSIIASLGILNLGLGDATIRYIAKYRDTDPLRTTRVANTTYSFYLFLSMAAFVLAMGYLMAEESWNLFVPQDQNSFIKLLELGIVLFVIRLLEQIIFSIYKGFERYDLFSKLSIGSKVTLVITNIVVVLWGYSLDIILICSAASSFIFLFIEFLFLRKFLPGFQPLPQLDREILREILSFGLWSWLQSIIGILGYQLDKFLVASLAGLTVLAYYSVGFTITSQMFNVFVAISNWVFPRVSSQESSSNALLSLYHKSQFALGLFASVSITLFYFLKEPILVLWLGQDIYSKALPYVNAYCVYILLTTITIIPTFFTLGTNSMRTMTANSLFSLTLSAIGMYVMFHFFGPIGLVYGRTIAGLITIPVFLILLHKKVLPGSGRLMIQELALPFSFAALMTFNNGLALLVCAATLLMVSTFFIKRYFFPTHDPVS